MANPKKASVASLSSSNRWEVERDLECLMECEKIKADPKRMKLAQAMAKEKMMAAASVATESED